MRVRLPAGLQAGHLRQAPCRCAQRTALPRQQLCYRTGQEGEGQGGRGLGRREDVEWVGGWGGARLCPENAALPCPLMGGLVWGLERGRVGESMKGGGRGIPLNPSLSFSPPLSLTAITQTFSTMMDRFNKLYKRRCACVRMGGRWASSDAAIEGSNFFKEVPLRCDGTQHRRSVYICALSCP